MITLIEMPALSSTMRRGKVVKWYKREGDFVEKGETLFEAETDKVNVEVESLASGFLLKILLEEEIQVPANTPIAIIADSMDEDISSVIEARPSVSVSPGEVEPEEMELGISKPKISPLARRIAEEEGIDIQTIEGTGPGGRITKQDVERASYPPFANVISYLAIDVLFRLRRLPSRTLLLSSQTTVLWKTLTLLPPTNMKPCAMSTARTPPSR